jgi:CRISPR/Cas system-associated exonuclease Cas4 (RecB family)
MQVQLAVTDSVVEAYLKCPHKAYLRLTEVTGQPSEYVALQEALDADYLEVARSAWLRRRPLATVAAEGEQKLENPTARTVLHRLPTVSKDALVGAGGSAQTCPGGAT